jgi:hypothetical protein
MNTCKGGATRLLVAAGKGAESEERRRGRVRVGERRKSLFSFFEGREEKELPGMFFFSSRQIGPASTAQKSPVRPSARKWPAELSFFPFIPSFFFSK